MSGNIASSDRGIMYPEIYDWSYMLDQPYTAHVVANDISGYVLLFDFIKEIM